MTIRFFQKGFIAKSSGADVTDCSDPNVHLLMTKSDKGLYLLQKSYDNQVNVTAMIPLDLVKKIFLGQGITPEELHDTGLTAIDRDGRMLMFHFRDKSPLGVHVIHASHLYEVNLALETLYPEPELLGKKKLKKKKRSFWQLVMPRRFF